MPVLSCTERYMDESVAHYDDVNVSGHDNFGSFYENWIVEQDRYLGQLLSVSREHSSETSSREQEERVIRPLVNRVVCHYEEYYRAKSGWTKHDVLSMLSPSWRSSLEDAFLWIGGWRPSMAFHLLYSKSGLQLEAKLAEVIRGLTTGDLGDLTTSQLVLVDEMQRKTIMEEKQLTEKMAKQQEAVVDTSTVELSHMVTEIMMENNSEPNPQQVESTLAPKEEGLKKVMEKADDLRLRTLKGVINILSPIQAVHFLIAAAELHLRLHDWGMKKDTAAAAAAAEAEAGQAAAT